MGLSGAQCKQMERALRDAFQDRNALARVVRYHLDRNLADISQGANLEQDVFALVIWAETHGHLRKLIDGALEENPGNVALQAVAQFDLASTPLGSPGATAPFMAPPLPDWFVKRPAQFAALQQALLDPQRIGTVAITTALQGAGGFGKTTLAAALCHDAAVQAAFPDGILWVTMGEQPDVTRELARLHTALTGNRPTFADAGDAAAQLAAALAGKRCLVVIDDVWDEDHLRPFLHNTGGAHLITTRKFAIATETAASRVPVDEMTGDEAARLLTAGLQPPPADLASFRALAARLGEWPLLLELAHRLLRLRVAQGMTPGAALHTLNEDLDDEGVTAFDQQDKEARNQAIANTLAVSLKFLAPDERIRLYELAIFPEDIDIPFAVAGLLWVRSAAQTRRLGEKLADLALLKLDLPDGTIRLHDVVRKYLATQFREPATLHARLVDAWGRSADALPAAYAAQHLLYHLAGAGRLTESTQMNLVDSTLRLAAHILAEDPAQMAVQLLGRLVPDDGAEIATLLAQARQGTSEPRLYPLWPTLTPPGGPLLRTLTGHTGWVQAVAITPDGRHAISASDDRTLRVWKLDSGQPLRTLTGHTDAVQAVAITPDGRQAVSASDDRTLRVWDLERGQSLRVLIGHTHWVQAVAITPDGRHAISASSDRTLRVWDLDSGQLIRTLTGHTDAVRAVVVTPDGHHAVSASDDRTLRVWDLDRGQSLRVLTGRAGPGRAVAITPDGRHAVSASYDGRLRVWDLDYRQPLRTLIGHAGPILGVAITPDGRHAVSASYDGRPQVWDLDSGQLLRTLTGHTGRVRAVAITPDGRQAVSASDDRTLRVWDLDSGQPLRTLADHTGLVLGVAITPDGRYAISASSGWTLQVWDMDSGQSLSTLTGHTGWVQAVAITPDRRHVVSASSDGTLRVWDLDRGQSLRILTGHTDAIQAVAITPDGRQAVSTSDDRTLRVWDLDSGQPLRTLIGHTHWVQAVAITPDGRQAVSASDDQTLRMWDLDSGQLIRTLTGHTDAVRAVVVTPDGRQAVSASDDRTLRVWDLDKGQPLRVLIGHTHWVQAVAITPDGHHVVSASSDRTLRVWDLNRGQCIAMFSGDGGFYGCAIAPDGRTIVVGEASGRVHFLRLEGV